MEIAEIRKKLSRKLTFEDGISSLTILVNEKYPSLSPSERDEVLSLVKRTATLLQSRYTNVAYWIIGLHLFEAFFEKCNNSAHRKEIQKFIEKAKAEISTYQEKDEPIDEGEGVSQFLGGQSSTYLFEGQLSGSSAAPQPAWLSAQRAHFSLMGEVYQEQTRQQNLDQDTNLENVRPSEEESREENENSPADIETDSETTEDIPSLRSAGRRRLVEALVRFQREAASGQVSDGIDFLQIMRSAMFSGDEVDFPGLQEALQATFQETPKGNPPAAKSEVENLKKVAVTELFLEKLEGEKKCTVCQEEFLLREMAQMMPCKHWYHEECIGAWLGMSNTCPLCRMELRTDDEEYERRKEKERIEREERRGVENSLKLGDYMFM